MKRTTHHAQRATIIAWLAVLTGCASAEVTSTLNHQSYDGNGSQQGFTFSFGISAQTDLLVVCRTGATGVEAVQVLNSDYVLTDDDGDGDYTDGPGGTVTFVAAPASGVEVHLIRVPPLTQLIGIDNTPYLRLMALEDAVDRLVYQTQYLQQQLDRTPRIPITEGQVYDMNVPSAVERVGGYLGFDDDGDLRVGTSTDADVSAFWTAILDDPNLTASLVTIANATLIGLAGLDPDAAIGETEDVSALPVWSPVSGEWDEVLLSDYIWTFLAAPTAPMARTYLGVTVRESDSINFHASDLLVGTSPPYTAASDYYQTADYYLDADSLVTTILPDDCDTGEDIDITVVWFHPEAYDVNNGEVRFAGNWHTVATNGSESISTGGTYGAWDSGDAVLPAIAYGVTELVVGTIPAAALSPGDAVGIEVKRVSPVDGNNPAYPTLMVLEVRLDYATLY